MTDKERFISILNEHCKDRFDVKAFVKWLEDRTDFFDAPASTKYHLAVRGGLVKHSLNVYDSLETICSLYAEDVPQDSIAICGLLHDICKINFYTLENRNVKTKQGYWTTQQQYVIDDSFPIGHGEKSVILLQPHMKLRKDEIIAIRWHMAGFDFAAKGGELAYVTASLTCKLLSLLEVADNLSSRVIEGEF